MTHYKDENDNTYVVERASNGMYVTVRYNANGNRKGYRGVGPQRSRHRAQAALDTYAVFRSRWVAYKVEGESV